MSRSKHQRHRMSHQNKCPREILSVSYENGIRKLKYRKRKMKPYGRKNFIGYGEETYSKRFGEYFAPVINKKRYRREIKKFIEQEILFYQ